MFWSNRQLLSSLCVLFALAWVHTYLYWFNWNNWLTKEHWVWSTFAVQSYESRNVQKTKENDGTKRSSCDDSFKIHNIETIWVSECWLDDWSIEYVFKSDIVQNATINLYLHWELIASQQATNDVASMFTGLEGWFYDIEAIYENWESCSYLHKHRYVVQCESEDAPSCEIVIMPNKVLANTEVVFDAILYAEWEPWIDFSLMKLYDSDWNFLIDNFTYFPFSFVTSPWGYVNDTTKLSYEPWVYTVVQQWSDDTWTEFECSATFEVVESICGNWIIEWDEECEWSWTKFKPCRNCKLNLVVTDWPTLSDHTWWLKEWNKKSENR